MKPQTTGDSGSKKYSIALELLNEIDPSVQNKINSTSSQSDLLQKINFLQKSKYVVRPRVVEFVLQKKEAGPYWERLLKTAGKQKWLTIDWNKWKDEDEVGDDTFDTSDMGGMGGKKNKKTKNHSRFVSNC